MRSNQEVWLLPDMSKGTVEINYSKLLGEGSSGKIYLGASSEQGKLAVKIMDKYALSDSQKEVKIMESLVGPDVKNIVQMYGYFFDDKNITIAMTYAANGSLIDWLSNKKQLSPPQKNKVMLDVANGLAYVHEKGIIHCDVKPDNVLIDENMNALLCDFGLSKRKNVDDLSRFAGTAAYSSPEILSSIVNTESKASHSEKSDMYSFSLLCWCVAAQATDPFADFLPMDEATELCLLYDWVVKQNKREMIPEDPQCSEEVVNFIELGWDSDPGKRPTAKEALKMLSAVGDFDKEKCFIQSEFENTSRIVSEESKKNSDPVLTADFDIKVKSDLSSSKIPNSNVLTKIRRQRCVGSFSMFSSQAYPDNSDEKISHRKANTRNVK